MFDKLGDLFLERVAAELEVAMHVEVKAKLIAAIDADLEDITKRVCARLKTRLTIHEDTITMGPTLTIHQHLTKE